MTCASHLPSNFTSMSENSLTEYPACFESVRFGSLLLAYECSETPPLCHSKLKLKVEGGLSNHSGFSRKTPESDFCPLVPSKMGEQPIPPLYTLTGTEVLVLLKNNTITVEEYASSLLNCIFARDNIVKAWAFLPGWFFSHMMKWRGYAAGITDIKQILNSF